jgi:excisionase family DNA binding protein
MSAKSSKGRYLALNMVFCASSRQIGTANEWLLQEHPTIIELSSGIHFVPILVAITSFEWLYVIISSGGVIMTEKKWKAVSTKPRTVTIDKAAEVLAVSTTTIQKMMRDGRLHGIKRGRDWRILRSDLEPFVADAGSHKSAPSNKTER